VHLSNKKATRSVWAKISTRRKLKIKFLKTKFISKLHAISFVEFPRITDENLLYGSLLLLAKYCDGKLKNEKKKEKNKEGKITRP